MRIWIPSGSGNGRKALLLRYPPSVWRRNCVNSMIALFLIIKLIIFGIKTSKKHYALKQLKNIDTNSAVEAVIEMSLLLRRICNAKFKQASALYGQDWLDFLTKHSKSTLSEKASKLLVFAPFMDKNSTQYSSLEAQEVKNFCKHWIGENL